MNEIKTIEHFRADAAFCQYDVIKLLDSKVKHIYIGCRNSYVEKYFSRITNWDKLGDEPNSQMEVGEVIITPFKKQAKDDKNVQNHRNDTLK